MDARTFDNITRPLRGKLLRFSQWMLGNQEDAEDAVQETMLKLWRHREKWSSYENREAYAFRILKNTCLDVGKKKREQFDIPDHLTDNSASSQLYLEGYEAQNLMEEIIRQLPESQRMVLVLRSIEQKSTGEISMITGLSVSNVRVQLHRARSQVRQAWEKFYKNEDRRY